MIRLLDDVLRSHEAGELRILSAAARFIRHCLEERGSGEDYTPLS